MNTQKEHSQSQTSDAWSCQLDQIGHATPLDQPQQVHQLTSKLYAAYQVEGGNVQLAGCTLDDIPFIAVEFRLPKSDSLSTWYLDVQGNRLDSTVIDQLSLDKVETTTREKLRLRSSEVTQIAETAVQHLDQLIENGSPSIVSLTLIWLKYASGKLTVSIGDQSQSIPFQNWAHKMIEDDYVPPPFQCPATGKESYQVVAADDGKITTRDSLGQCEVSGHSAVETDLKRCCFTNKRALPQFLSTCEVSGDLILESVVKRCQRCDQAANPHYLTEGVCNSCRSMAAIASDDPRLRKWQEVHSGLGRWSHFSFAESHANYLLQAKSWLSKHLFVIDKSNSEIIFAGKSPRWANRFRALSADEKSLLLNSSQTS